MFLATIQNGSSLESGILNVSIYNSGILNFKCYARLGFSASMRSLTWAYSEISIFAYEYGYDYDYY